MDYKAYFKNISEKNRMAADTIQLKPAKGIPTGGIVHLLQHSHIERLAGVEPGEYKKNPHEVYIACIKNIGMNLLDQYLAENPLTMGDNGYDEWTEHGATTGAEKIIFDGILIDSPEAVVEHTEKYVIPGYKSAIAKFNEEEVVKAVISYEYDMQERLGPEILKTGDGLIFHPTLAFEKYGYENYFMAYALYPEVLEKLFSIEADYGFLYNKAVVKAYEEGGMPKLIRFEHDIADSRGTLVDIKSLDKMWLPQFARSIQPIVNAGIRTLWHCDGNLIQMVPRLIEAGVTGFQGFQYEDGMDYEKICKMKSKDGENLVIWGGVSVTRTLPFGTPSDVKKEIEWLVEKGPETGLCLTTSSSVAPGVPWENIKMMVEGFKYYREHGRG